MHSVQFCAKAQNFFMGFLQQLAFGLRLWNAASLLLFLSFPGRALAYEYDQAVIRQHLEFVREAAPTASARVAGVRQVALNETFLPKVGRSYAVVASAYSSTISQTDSDPFTTASGSRARLGTLAANFLPLGTQVRIGGIVYTVDDRMNSRFDGQYVVDIWMNSSELATQFGVRALTLEIISLP